jgi:hypothetical protein
MACRPAQGIAAEFLILNIPSSMGNGLSNRRDGLNAKKHSLDFLKGQICLLRERYPMKNKYLLVILTTELIASLAWGTRAPSTAATTEATEETRVIDEMMTIAPFNVFPPDLVPLVTSFLLFPKPSPFLWASPSQVMLQTQGQLLLFKPGQSVNEYDDDADTKHLYRRMSSIIAHTPKQDPEFESKILSLRFFQRFDANNVLQAQFITQDGSLLLLHHDGSVSYANSRYKRGGAEISGWEGSVQAPKKEPFFDSKSGCLAGLADKIVHMHVGYGIHTQSCILRTRDGRLLRTAKERTSSVETVPPRDNMTVPTCVFQPSREAPQRAVDVAMASGGDDAYGKLAPERVLVLFEHDTRRWIELVSYSGEVSSVKIPLKLTEAKEEKEISVASITTHFANNSRLANGDLHTFFFAAIDVEGNPWISYTGMMRGEKDTLKLTELHEGLKRNMRRIGGSEFGCTRVAQISITDEFSMLRCEDGKVFIHDHDGATQYGVPRQSMTWPIPLKLDVPDATGKELVQILATREGHGYLLYKDGSLLEFNIRAILKSWRFRDYGLDPIWLVLNTPAAAKM